ncbi:MAG: hypothetical protein Q8L68_04520 [Methylococcales bacterium]|nr:hypothetical protein [Methylococcales bacterium]
MKVKLPSEVRIGTHTFKIRFDPHLFSDENKYGLINYRAQEINIWSEAPLSTKNEALLHEIIHLSQHVYRVEISDQDIDRVAETIGEFLFNNLGIEFDWSCISENVDKVS